MNFRTVLQTGDRLYGGAKDPFLFYNDRPTHLDYEPLGIYQVKVEGIMLPTDGSKSGQNGSNYLNILGAGRSDLTGYYEYRQDNPTDTQWLWRTTGDYQTTDSYTNWVNDVLAKQATISSVQTFATAISQGLGLLSLIPVGGSFAWLPQVAGTVSFLLGSVYFNAPSTDPAHAIGNMTNRDRITFTYTYAGGGVGTPKHGDHYDVYAVPQTNNYLDVSYGGYSPWQYQPTLEIHVQVLLADPWYDNYGENKPYPEIWEVLDYTFDIQLSSLFAPTFTDTTLPSPVQNLTGSTDQSGNATLSWTSNYYTGDNDWISSYIVSDGTNSWPLNNTMGQDPYQNNGYKVYQGLGTTRTYTVVAKDPTGKTSAPSTVTVTIIGPPAIQFTDPPGDKLMFSPVSYTFHVNVTDPSGIVTSVQMYSLDLNTPGDPIFYPATHGSGSDWYYTFSIFGDTTFEIRAKATSTTGLSTYATIHVSSKIPARFVVTQPDITTDIRKSFTLQWLPTSSAPTTYVITRNGTQVANGQWANGVYITYTASLDSLKHYKYTITIYDNFGKNASSSAMVTVIGDQTPPAFTYRQPNIGDIVGDPFTLTWTATDVNPNYYVITRDGVQVASWTWQSGVPITYTATLWGTGTFTYTITVYDQQGNSASATCTVTVRGYQ